MRTALIGIAVAVGVWLVLIGSLVLAGRGPAARELARLVPDLAALFKGLVRDPRVPRRTKAGLWIALAWVLSPIDLIPEFIPVAGPLDDAIVAALAVRAVVRAAGRPVLEEHWRGRPETLDRIVALAGSSRRDTL